MNPKIVLKDFESSFISKRKEEKEEFKFWINSTYIIMLLLIGFLLTYHVWTINVNATKWYNIRELKEEKRSLLIEQEKLNIKIAELESFSEILWESDLEGMEKSEKPDYLVIKEGVQYVYND